jgi:hypothetical protein
MYYNPLEIPSICPFSEVYHYQLHNSLIFNSPAQIVDWRSMFTAYRKKTPNAGLLLRIS